MNCPNFAASRGLTSRGRKPATAFADRGTASMLVAMIVTKFRPVINIIAEGDRENWRIRQTNAMLPAGYPFSIKHTAVA